MSENRNNDSTEPTPVIADKMPAVIKLEAGEYWWCSCGKSSKQPFCDGSHQGLFFPASKGRS
jgi:CDGSH-type Zn-finger protein